MNERQTLRLLAWVFGGLVFGVFVLDMIAMSQSTVELRLANRTWPRRYQAERRILYPQDPQAPET